MYSLYIIVSKVNVLSCELKKCNKGGLAMKRTRIVMLLLVVLSISLLLVIGCNNPKVEGKKEEVIGAEEPDTEITDKPDDNEEIDEVEEPEDVEEPDDEVDDNVDVDLDEDIETVLYMDEQYMLAQLKEDDDSYPEAWADDYALKGPHYKGALVFTESSEDNVETFVVVHKGREVFAETTEFNPNKGVYLIDVKDQSKRYLTTMVYDKQDAVKIMAWSYSVPELEFEEIPQKDHDDLIVMYEGEGYKVLNNLKIEGDMEHGPLLWGFESWDESTFGIILYANDIYDGEESTVSGLIATRKSDGTLDVKEHAFKPVKNTFIEFDESNVFSKLHFVSTDYFDFGILVWLIDD